MGEEDAKKGKANIIFSRDVYEMQGRDVDLLI
jgi:hypothetical protein